MLIRRDSWKPAPAFITILFEKAKGERTKEAVLRFIDSKRERLKKLGEKIRKKKKNTAGQGGGCRLGPILGKKIRGEG